MSPYSKVVTVFDIKIYLAYWARNGLDHLGIDRPLKRVDMPFGYTGNILRVDLSTSKIKVEKQDDDNCRSYLGRQNIRVSLNLC